MPVVRPSRRWSPPPTVRSGPSTPAARASSGSPPAGTTGGGSARAARRRSGGRRRGRAGCGSPADEPGHADGGGRRAALHARALQDDRRRRGGPRRGARGSRPAGAALARVTPAGAVSSVPCAGPRHPASGSTPPAACGSRAARGSCTPRPARAPGPCDDTPPSVRLLTGRWGPSACARCAVPAGVVVLAREPGGLGRAKRRDRRVTPGSRCRPSRAPRAGAVLVRVTRRGGAAGYARARGARG